MDDERNVLEEVLRKVVKIVDDDLEPEWKRRRVERSIRKVNYGLGGILQMMRANESNQKGESRKKQKTVEREKIPAMNKENQEFAHLANELKWSLRSEAASTYQFSKIGVDGFSPVDQLFFRDNDSNFSASGKSNDQCYLRNCKWSPDGEYLLTSSNDRSARIFKLSTDENKLVHQKTIQFASLVFDADWSKDHKVFATCSRNRPVQLWDIAGKRLATFRGVNEVSEPHDIVHMVFFSKNYLYTGLKGNVKWYDLESGSEVPVGSTLDAFSSSSRYPDGGKNQPTGITSCMALNPIRNDIVIGGYCGNIRRFDHNSPNIIMNIPTDLSSGVTHLEYDCTNSAAELLYVGGRGKNQNTILCYDLRNIGSYTTSFELDREVDTQQSIGFQIDSTGNHLVSGSTNGEILYYDLKAAKEANTPLKIKPTLSCKASDSSVCCLSLNPKKPLLATGHGQRIFRNWWSESDEDESCEESTKKYERGDLPVDNSVKLWDLSKL